MSLQWPPTRVLPLPTKIKPVKSTLSKALDYIENPDKTDNQMLISSFGCSYETADIELSLIHICLMKVTGGIHTKAYGQENLPKEGGYMMYPNHQGKYDALGIVYTPVSYTHLLMKSLVLGLQGIQNTYGNDYIILTFKEV